MGDCNFNGTCASCTHDDLQYVETEDKLVCCVSDGESVPGWIRFIARSPSDCPSVHVYPPAMMIVSIVALIVVVTGVILCCFRKFRSSRPPLITRARSVFSRYENYGRMSPAPINWEAVELDSIRASMEMTTAL